MKKEVKCKTYSLVEKYVIISYQFFKKKILKLLHMRERNLGKKYLMFFTII